MPSSTAGNTLTEWISKMNHAFQASSLPGSTQCHVRQASMKASKRGLKRKHCSYHVTPFCQASQTAQSEAHQNEQQQLQAPRSPFNTGSMDITTAGATVSLADKPLQNEKQIIIVRHGLTTWNEQHRIQVRGDRLHLCCVGCEA